MRRSLIEKLSAERDESSPLSPEYRSINELRDAVTRDLEELLNTRSEAVRVLTDAFPESLNSSLTYGIPDFSSSGLLAAQDRDRIRRGLEKAIGLHERRLTRVRVILEPPREHERALRFRVDAMLDLGNERDKVHFDAVLQLNTQVCAVN